MARERPWIFPMSRRPFNPWSFSKRIIKLKFKTMRHRKGKMTGATPRSNCIFLASKIEDINWILKPPRTALYSWD